MQPGYDPPSAGERWNVNMPAVIGVVFVFLVGVVIWVVSTSGGDDEPAQADDPTEVSVIPGSPGGVDPSSPTNPTTPPTLSPTPLPSTVPTSDPTATTTPPPTSPPPTTNPPPVTTAPGAETGAVPGDLGVPGRPMQQPTCDGSYITVLASAIGAQATAPAIAVVLDQYPGSNYLRTDQTCSSLNPSLDGEPIYVVYFGPFAFDTDACTARADGPTGAYARQLSNDVSPQHSVTCP
jgi:serine/threonine-protein kinase